MFTVHATKKLLDRARASPVSPVPEPGTALGNWYATELLWRPQAALLVDEATLFPVLMPLAPAAALLDRFPAALRVTLEAAGISPAFVEPEIAAMGEGRWAKTANRSVPGIVNQFAFLSENYRERRGATDLIALSSALAQTPCGPLYGRHVSPDRELAALVAEWTAAR